MGEQLARLLPALLLLVAPGSSAITGPGAVKGWERGSLTVQCRYDRGYETYVKWWCRGAAWGSCKVLVRTTGSEQEVKMGRVSIRDHQEDHVFTVTMEALTRGDADTYWCGVEKAGADLGDQVKVTVDPGSSAVTGPGAVKGWERGSLTVQCRYGRGYETYVKWWCRGAAWISCKILVRTTGSEQEVKTGRVSIRDHHRHRTITVTMEALTRGDAGTYWCGVDRAGADPAAQVKVTVDPATTVSTTTTTTTTTTTIPTTTTHHTAPVFPEEDTVPPAVTSSRSQLGSVHFLLLVFLKLPLLLGMLSAVLWVHRPQRRPGGRQSQPD